MGIGFENDLEMRCSSYFAGYGDIADIGDVERIFRLRFCPEGSLGVGNHPVEDLCPIFEDDGCSDEGVAFGVKNFTCYLT